ncbi:MAG: site-specific integrase [Nitrososphaerota archaeon]
MNEYLRVARDSFIKQRKHYALFKVLNVFLSCSENDDLDALIEKYKENVSGLHVVVQKTINVLEVSGKNGSPLTPKTVHFYINLLKNFLDFCDVETEKAWKKIKLPKKAPRRIERIPKKNEIIRLMMGCKSPRMRLLIQLLAQTGLRLNEALQLKLSDIDLNNGWLRVRPENDKTARGREVPLIRELADAIREYLSKREVDSEYLFPSLENPAKPARKEHVYVTFYDLIKRLGLAGRDPSGLGYEIHFHSFRKFFKTQLELANVNSRVIDKWMGHKNDVQDSYFLPSRNMLREEIAKAEKALSLFMDRDEEDHEKLKQIEDEAKKLRNMLENIKNKIQDVESFIGKLNVTFDEDVLFLENLRRMIAKNPELASSLLENMLEDIKASKELDPWSFDFFMFRKYGEKWIKEKEKAGNKDTWRE